MSSFTTTTQCLTCDNFRSKYNPRCEDCIIKKPNVCEICDMECAGFKSCYGCRADYEQKKRDTYTGKHCKDCRKPSNQFVRCYPCGQKHRENYCGLYCIDCDKPSNAYIRCFPCGQEHKKGKGTTFPFEPS